MFELLVDAYKGTIPLLMLLGVWAKIEFKARTQVNFTGSEPSNMEDFETPHFNIFSHNS